MGFGRRVEINGKDRRRNETRDRFVYLTCPRIGGIIPNIHMWIVKRVSHA